MNSSSNKRRLSKQQTRRIANRQQDALRTTQPGGEGAVGAESSVDSALEQCNGRVVGHYGKQLEVEALGDDRSVVAAVTARCHQRANLPPVVAGDLVVWEADEDGQGVVVARGQRRNAFGRASGRVNKPMAANVDLVLVMVAVVPEAFCGLIDRYVVAVEALGLPLLLVINKSDLMDESNVARIDGMVSLYGSLGYPVHLISVRDGDGLAALNEKLTGLTAVLVGQSGVGKSSLVNALGVRDLAQTGALSKRKSKGKGTHTTTTARLYHLVNFNLIDSPGIREFGLDHIEEADIWRGFVEFRPFLGQCKYRDCSHQHEPGCALREALARGQLRQERFDSCFQILHEHGAAPSSRSALSDSS
ncbi:MAG: ribosome small subunit-dependent GTPase A [Pseudohongiellaceae bacterium]